MEFGTSSPVSHWFSRVSRLRYRRRLRCRIGRKYGEFSAGGAIAGLEISAFRSGPVAGRGDGRLDEDLGRDMDVAHEIRGIFPVLRVPTY